MLGVGSSRALRALLLATAAGAVPALAALYQSENWAVVGTVAGRTGYDSNLTLSNDGPDDTLFQVNPYLTLVRRNSSTDFRINGGITSTEFLNGREEQQNDLTVSTSIAYPYVPGTNELPVYRGEASWSSATEPNTFLGRRIDRENTSVSADGYLSLTGKFGLRGSVDFDTTDYKELTLNQNRRARAFAGLAYELRPRVETSFNLGYGDGESKPNNRVFEPVESREVYAFARIRGEITAKLSGSMYGGFGEVSYKGSYVNSYSLPIAGADLTWGFDPRRTGVIALYSGAEYTPDGQSVNITRGTISYTHVIVSSWQYVVRVGYQHSTFRREFRQREDDTYSGGAEFAYKPSDRFRIAVATSYTKQESSIAFNTYDRTAVTLETSWRF